MTGAAAAVRPLRLRRLDLRAPDAATRRERDALFRRGAVPDPAVREAARRILADVRERGGDGRPRRRGAVRRRAPRRPAAARPATSSPRPPTPSPPAQRAALETAIANVRRFAETQRPAATRTTIVPGVELERRWLPVDRAGAYVPGRLRAVPLVAGHDRRPGAGRGRRRDRRRQPGRRAAATSTPSCSAPPGCSGVDGLLVAGGVQAIGALAFGLPDEGLRARRPRRRPRQRVGHGGQGRARRRRRRSTCPPGPRRASCSRTRRRPGRPSPRT